MKNIRFALRATMLVLLFIAPVFAAWTKVETANFTVLGNGGEKGLRKVGFKLEQFRKILSTVLPGMKLNSSLPTIIYVFDTENDFKPYRSMLGKEKDKENVAAYFYPGSDANYVAMSRDYTDDVFSRIIFHEYFHFVMSKNLKRAPLWLEEGLAEYYGAMQINDDGLKFTLGQPLPSLVNTLRHRNAMPLQQLFSVNTRSPEYNNNDKAGRFYSQSWALIHYLLLGNEQKYRDGFPVLVNSLINDNATAEEAFQKAYKVSSAQMEKELDLYVRKFSFTVMNSTLAQKIDWDATFKASPVSKAEEAARLGDLFFILRRDAQAEEKYLEALAADLKYSPAYMSYGKLRLRQNNGAEAKKNFEKSIEADPANHLGHSYLGSVLMTEGKMDAAIASHKKAIELKPDIARLQGVLAVTYRNADRDREAVLHYSKAVALEPQEESYYYPLSYILFRTNARYQAAARATEFISHAGWNDPRSPYAAMFAFLGYKSLPNTAAGGDSVLKQALEKTDRNAWPYPILRYLNKEITQDELLRLADNKDKQTEAYTYVGLNLMLDKKSDEAMTHFKWAKENGNKALAEYKFSLREIDRIEAAAAKSSN